jgi:hypothetical protein
MRRLERHRIVGGMNENYFTIAIYSTNVCLVE